MLWGEPEYGWSAAFWLLAGGLPSNLLSAVTMSLMAEQGHNGCEMYLEASRMIYVMNYDKRDEFTFCIITSLRWYKHQLPAMVAAVAQQCDALFQDLTALWAVCLVSTVSVTFSETHTELLSHFSSSLKFESGLSPLASVLIIPQGCQVGSDFCLG